MATTSPIEIAIHDISVLDGGISSDGCAAAAVMMMMMMTCVRRDVGGNSRNRESAEDGCYGGADRKLRHDSTPLKTKPYLLTHNNNELVG